MATLLGREEEERALGGLLDSARAERSAVLVLRGEPGIGKTALLEATARRGEGMMILHCVGIEAEHELAFAGLHQLVRPCLDLIDQLPEPQAAALRGALGLSSEPVTDRFLVSLGLLSLLAECADQTPLLCLVDDAQWLDQPSAEAILFAARRLEAEPIAVVIAAREGDTRRFDAPGLPELKLAGIADADAADMLRAQASHALPADLLAALIDAAGGNPLALLEMPAALTPGQVQGAEPIVGPPRARGAVETEYRSRVEALPDAARRALLVAAADELGDTGVVSRAIEHLGGSLDDLDPAVDAGLASVDDGIEFRHPLVRSAVYRAASRDERALAHAALATVVDDPGRSVWHRAAVTNGPDEGLAAELEVSGDQAAARGAQATAAVAFERAAELSEVQSSRASRLRRAAESSMDAGRMDTALALLERVRPLIDDPAQLASLDLLRAAQAGRRGSPADAHALIKQAGDTLVDSNSDQARMLYLWSLFTSFQGGWAEQIVGDLAERLSRLDGAGNPELERYGRETMAGISAIVAADPGRAAAHFDEAERLGERLPYDSLQGMPTFVLVLSRWALVVIVAMIRGEFGRLCAISEQAVAQLRARGSIVGVSGSVSILAAAQVFDRRLRQATVSIEEGLQLARQLGYENDEVGLLSLRARVAAVQGREDACRADGEEALRAALAQGLGWATLNVRLALGELELGLGNARAAVDQFDQLDRSVLPPIAMLAVPDLVDALLRVGEGERATEAVDAYRRWAPISRAPLVHATLARCRAQVADDPAEAEELFTESLGHHGPDAVPFERARTHLAFGERLRRERRKADARVHLRVALDTFEGVGAALWAERARGELQATGETARKRDPSTIDDLTPQELRIAQLVAGGATNRDVAAQLFVSPKTVEYHLRKVFMKLGVKSRVELAGAQLGDTLIAAD